MFDRSLLNPILSGKVLYDALLFLPDDDESVSSYDASTRLVALSELYNIYLPSGMSERDDPQRSQAYSYLRRPERYWSLQSVPAFASFLFSAASFRSFFVMDRIIACILSMTCSLIFDPSSCL